eukprot:CAMPEP_0175994584 /NCGR_PEP_ID=MMETSP0108-20121206/54671_1 /TAXON_ID=195067 ORGANISM="Goniomonas pacifica, Strain CCMP1869" /NCGR_SAMPLE_ID=MMETSP0108 /ASSEMBLY_ACC=CAM_ASM_000204 /LENGTH=51 /DNA_ID=CAMNT_0017326639 /DNA_START=406 /DNA_END=561 /DNA_ORIENTATION=+
MLVTLAAMPLAVMPLAMPLAVVLVVASGVRVLSPRCVRDMSGTDVVGRSRR